MKQLRLKILINGAGGSIGTYALQLAKQIGAVVSCVDNAEKLETLSSIGADHVIDYTKEDFTRNTEAYDVIIDIVGKSSFSRSIRSLKHNGRYVLGNSNFTGIIRGLWISIFTSKKVIAEMASYKTENFSYLLKLLKAGKIKPIIDKSYPLEQIPEAHTYVESNHKTGNIIISIAHENKM